MKNFLLKIDKRIKFLIQALVVGVFLHYIFLNSTLHIYVVMSAALFLAMFGSLFVHYPNFKSIKSYLLSLLLPFSLLSGAILFLRFYPNLGDIFRIVIILGFVFIYYLILLSDNIFLVVIDREETIPLYRVAVTWSLILITLTAIPLYSGIFKLSYYPIVHMILVFVFGFLFNAYQIWSTRFDEDSKNVGVGEYIFLSTSVGFFILCSAAATMFIPSEAFLRALFTAAVLMFGLNYTSFYLKNNVSKRMLLEYSFICFIFLALLVLFKN